MTMPIGHGYPDYGRYQARTDIILDTETDTVIDVPDTRGRYFVGHVETYGLRFTPTVNHFAVAPRFFDSQAGGNEFSSHNYSIRANGGIDIMAPTLGPWMQIDLTPSAAGATFSMRTWTGHSLGRSFRGQATDSILLSQVDPAVGAGATVNFDSGRVWPGMVHWHVSTALAGWVAQLGVFDWAGVFTVIDQFDQAGGAKQSNLVFLPPVNARIAFQNTTGAAGAARVILAARPMGPGW